MTQPFTLHQGCVPLLVSIPHLGTLLPEEVRVSLSEEAQIVSDTDWHLDRLYDFAKGMGASMLSATVSRYVIDLNRPPTGESLYPGQTTTGLCPVETFRGVPLYRSGTGPDDTEIARRRQMYWQPYHAALEAELQRLRAAHGQVLLWEAHSIASVLPRLFEGKLPDLNFGTNSGASCAPEVIEAVLEPVVKQSRFSHILNGRFKGGYITRQYGQPGTGVHAMQLEMCQSLYMSEERPFDYHPNVASHVQSLLQDMLGRGLEQVRAKRSR